MMRGAAITARERGGRALTAAAAVVFPLVLWELASRTVLNATLIPPPSVVAGTAWTMLRTGELFVHVAISLRRILMGFVLGSGLGIALVPLAMVWFGIDEGARLFLIIYLAAVLMVPATLTGVASIKPIRLRAAE